MNVIETTEVAIVSSVNESINEVGTEKPHTTLIAKGFEWLIEQQNFDARFWLDDNLVIGTVNNFAYLVDIRKNVFDKDFSILLGQAEEFRSGGEVYIDAERCQCVDNEDGAQFEAIRLVFTDDFNGKQALLDVLVR